MTLNLTNEDRLLPFGRVTTVIFPLVGGRSLASKGGDNLSGGEPGQLFRKLHGRSILSENKSAMRKINLDNNPQCGHCLRMSNTAKSKFYIGFENGKFEVIHASSIKVANRYARKLTVKTGISSVAYPV